jgi:hypothetical protein
MRCFLENTAWAAAPTRGLARKRAGNRSGTACCQQAGEGRPTKHVGCGIISRHGRERSEVCQERSVHRTPQIPGLGGKSFKLPDDGGAAPGLIVYFPNVNTAFVTAAQATIAVPAISKKFRLKWVASVSDKSVQYGLGNSIPIGGHASNTFFWNVRASATELARGAALSLRGETKGNEVVLGTLNDGLLQKPTYPDGHSPSHLPDLVAGAGFQAQVAAKDGQIVVKHGTVLLPIAVWEASMVALSAAATQSSNLACDGRTLMERVGDVARSAVGRPDRLLCVDELAEWAAAIGPLLGAQQSTGCSRRTELPAVPSPSGVDGWHPLPNNGMPSQALRTSGSAPGIRARSSGQRSTRSPAGSAARLRRCVSGCVRARMPWRWRLDTQPPPESPERPTRKRNATGAVARRNPISHAQEAAMKFPQWSPNALIAGRVQLDPGPPPESSDFRRLRLRA